MAKRTKHTYTPQRRATILATAARERLTANEVEKRFGVIPVTYYSWRKKEGLTGHRGRKPTLAPLRDGGAYTRQFQARVRAMVPKIVREEVARSLGTLFPLSGRPGRPRKVL